MKKMRFHEAVAAVLCLGALACSREDKGVDLPREGFMSLTCSIRPFEGEGETRTNLAGDAFAVGDRMKLKIICPFTDRTQFGETTYGDTMDALWILKWTGSGWTPITAADKVDVAAQYAYTASRNLFGMYEAQQTPYVYTASTWSENVRFISGGNYYSQYSYIFHADQTMEEDYLHSDLLWAQTFMQTGSYDVHLAFRHVLSCLKIDVSGLSLTPGAVVTLEGMPDIDQREIVVGDYYAARSKINSGFGYQQKCLCSKDDNGRVLGVAVIDDALRKAVVQPMTGNPGSGEAVPNTGVYTAHRNGDHYCLIVPPCTLSDKAVIWVRDGERRYSYELQLTTFEQGKFYPVTITTP